MPDYSGFPGKLIPYLESFAGDVDGLMRRLQLEEIDEDAWRDSFAELMASYILTGYFVSGKRASVTSEAGIWLEAWLAAQLAYLDGFRDTILTSRAAGGQWTPGIDARAQMYITAMVAPYWYAETEGLPLPALPGDGSSQCRQNDKCKWRIEWDDRKLGNARAYWELRPAEHCQTCIERARRWNPLVIRNWQLVLPDVVVVRL